MAEEQGEKSNGERLLSCAWFAALQELTEIVMESESTSDRIAAGDVLLRYFISLGQSINDPYIPDDSEYEDNDDDD